MVRPSDDARLAPGVPVQRTKSEPAALGAGRPAPGGELIPARRPPAAGPTVVDVGIAALTRAFATARSAADVGILVGRGTLGRLPIPKVIRARTPLARLAQGSAGARRAELRNRLSALLDQAVPLLARELLARIDLTRLVREFVDLDALVATVDLDSAADRVDVDRVADRVDLDRAVSRVDLDRILERVDLDQLAARIDLDRIVDRVDIDRILDRVDLDRIAARLDLDPILDRVELDRLAERIDLDRIVDRVDLDRAVTRVDLDPIIERADVLGLARYIVDAIDLPGIIRSSTGSITSDMVHGVRAQGADADEAVQRVVDRWLRRRRRRDDLAPGGDT